MVETIAAYLGILDILVRLARYGDRRLSRGVSSAVKALGAPDPNLSVDHIRTLFQTALNQRVGIDRARVIQRAVEAIEEVATTAQLAGTLEDHERHELVPFGTVLARVVSVVGMFLDRMRVFDARHEEEYTLWSGTDGYDHAVIVAPYTWNLLRVIRPQKDQTQSGGPAMLYFKKIKPIWSPRVEYHLAGYYVGPNNMRLDRAQERYRDLRFGEFKMQFSQYTTPTSVKSVSDIDFPLFEALLLGLLLDMITYDRQVINEINESKLLIRNILGFGRPRLHLPF